MIINKEKDDEVLEKISGILKEYVIRIFGEMGFKGKITDKEAENALENIGMYLMKKNNIVK